MRVAVIGNMNNNGFSLMRYFRDLGADAWLLAFSNPEPQFAPEFDTWHWSRWKPFFLPTPIPNSSEAIIGNVRGLKPPPSIRSVRAVLKPYDRFVGCGIVPAVFERIGQKLDIFYPYSIGIEFYGDTLFRSRLKASPVRRLLHQRVRTLQAAGIRNSRYCVNAELSLTQMSFAEIGKSFVQMPIPMLYNREELPVVEPPAKLRDALGRIGSADLSLFSAARQIWAANPEISEAYWSSYTKNSDWLIRGLADFVKNRPDVKVLLTLVEYGRDVEASKRLAEELGIRAYVQWLPLLPRREIMLLLQASHIGVGEFYTKPGLLWGGTGWETLAAGRPLLQAFNFTHAEFEAEFGHAPPPILDVKSPADVSRQLSSVLAMGDKGRSIGTAAASWFNEHAGMGLARRWLDLLSAHPEDRS